MGQKNLALLALNKYTGGTTNRHQQQGFLALEGLLPQQPPKSERIERRATKRVDASDPPLVVVEEVIIYPTGDSRRAICKRRYG